MPQEELNIELNIDFDGTKKAVPGSTIESVELTMTPYGFKGKVAFWVMDSKAVGGSLEDGIYKNFVKNTINTADLTISSNYQKLSGHDSPPELYVKGPMTVKRFSEQYVQADRASKPYVERRYEFEFADAAYVFWSQHFPCELYVDGNMKKVFDEHKGKALTLKYEVPDINENRNILFLPLGDEKNQASFYDFTQWYLDGLHATLNYDSVKDTYTLSNKKADSTKTESWGSLDIESLRVILPETPRFAVRMMNADSEQSKKTDDITNDEAVTGVRKDVLIRTAVAKEFDARKKYETARLVLREPELKVEFKQFPNDPFIPSTLVKFEGHGWHDKAYQAKKTFRVRELNFKCRSQNRRRVTDTKERSRINFEMSAVLENKDEKHFPRPAYINPQYPVYVEGHVVSEQGKDEEETFQIYEDKDTSLEQHKVEIPLWKKQKVVIPFAPEINSSQYFFPAIKGARVLVALKFQSGVIVRHLDWRPGARMPQDGQGNHLYFGLTDKSKTQMQHFYEESKPVFKIKRTNEKDTELIQLEDGTMILQTCEE